MGINNLPLGVTYTSYLTPLYIAILEVFTPCSNTCAWLLGVFTSKLNTLPTGILVLVDTYTDCADNVNDTHIKSK